MLSGLYRPGWMCAGIVAAVLLGGGRVQAQPEAGPEPEVRVFRIGATGPSFLGVGIKEIDSERAKQLKLKEEAGVEVTRVEEDSPAAKAGLKVGDAIVQYNGEHVEGMEQFSRFVRETPAGREVKLSIVRDGNPQTIAVKIASRKNMLITPQIAPFTMPRVEIPPMPDFPHNLMMWRSSMLGIEAEPLGGQLADYFGVKEGVLVRSVIKDSAAEKAGIKAGDVITKVNDRKVAAPGEISSILRSVEGTKTVAVVLMRDHKEMTVNANVDSDNSDWPGHRPQRGRAVKM